MKKQNLTIGDKVSNLFLSFFGSGYFPFAPGTAGSLATIPLFFLFSWLEFSLSIFVSLVVVLTIVACLVTEHIQTKFKVHDPGWIVIDEVIGMLITWAFTYLNTNFLPVALGFGLFRFFDIVKIWPASYFDKKVRHGAGTILDDVVSGVFAGLSLLAINYFYKFL